MPSIRPAEPRDASAIRLVNERAFGRPAEADLVQVLQAACSEQLSLVAEDESDGIVGHILFTPVVVEHSGGSVVGVGLAPMSVLPEHQRSGIGTALAERALTLLRERRCPFVVVLGHPAYYPRFGFGRASAHGLRCPWEGVPDEAFMACILDGEVMRGVSGIAQYRSEFDAAL